MRRTTFVVVVEAPEGLNAALARLRKGPFPTGAPREMRTHEHVPTKSPRRRRKAQPFGRRRLKAMRRAGRVYPA